LIAHAARTRNLRAGSIVGSGTVSNADAARGYGCIAEKRALETIEHGQPRTAFLAVGDTVRIELKGRDGLSVFGAIEQRVSGPLDLAAAAAEADGAADAAADRGAD
jgi:fumarylacetoacetate (FAA) hydrolase